MAEHQKTPSEIKLTLVIAGILSAAIVGGFFLYRQFTPTPASPTPTLPTEGVTATPSPSAEPGEAGRKYGIQVNLSEGRPGAEVVESLPLATGESLSGNEIQAILDRLPALTPEPGQQVKFNLPAELLAPPRPGNTIEQSFPPQESAPGPETVESGPLQVLRYAPEGEIPIAPFVSITFNQPMVPLGTLGDLAESEVPARIEPALTGTWRWLGTRTLTFEYDSELIDRLPKATAYRVTIPAGTKSISGRSLAEPVTWTFSTPPPKIVNSYPDDTPQPLEPVFFIAFDQRIVQAAVLKTIQVTAGDAQVSLKLASEEDIRKNEIVKKLMENAVEGRWLVFRALEPFAPETSIHVVVGPETPSAEGPLLTTEAQTFSFSTYSPLRIVDHRCSWYGDRCPPLAPFIIRFNNPLETSAFSENMLKIEPEIPGLSIDNYGDTIQISGETKGQTTYTVRVSGEIQDTFGQTLGDQYRLTFRVGKADPVLVGPGQSFMTVDPAASAPVFSVYAINYSKVNLKIYSVQPSDWPKFKEVLRTWRQTDDPPAFPGRLVEDKSMTLNLPDDTLTPVDINLAKYTDAGFGQFIVFIEPPASLFESENAKWRRYSQTIMTWVQVTHIGLDAYNDQSEIVAWATDLRDGRPLSGVSIRPDQGEPAYVSGKDGIVRFGLPSGATYLTARQGNDLAMLPHSTSYWADDGWHSTSPRDTLGWYVFDDRGMYKPGEEVHLKGWLRAIGGRQDGDVGLVGGLDNFVVYTLYDSQGNSIGEGRTKVSGLGGFDIALAIPEVTNLGTATLHLTAEGTVGEYGNYQSDHTFEIQEFRRPEYEVAARNETTGPYFAGDHATLAVEAKYYAGGGLPNAETTWSVTTSPGSYSPPNWPDFTFGNWKPWWFFDYGSQYPPGSGDSQTQTFSGVTDTSGTHYLGLDFAPQGNPAQEPGPQSVVAQATVMDVNRQAWSSTTTLLVHPADLYIGIRSDRYFVQKGTPLKVEFIVTDLDGNPVAGHKVEMRAARLDWKLVDGKWTEVEVDVQKCSKTSVTEPDSCTFETPVGGSYRIVALVTDSQSRKNQSSFTRWVSGAQRHPSRKVEQEQVTLVPDKDTYQPGDTAEILVQSPFSPAEGLLTVTRSGILYTSRFQVEDGTATLKIPIEEKHIPNLNIQVDLVGAAARIDEKGEIIQNMPPRPAFASDQLSLSVPPLERTLSLQVRPDQSRIEPGSETSLTVQVKDAQDRPVSDAELAVVVADESILALTNYQISNPLSVFYANRPSYLTSIYGRSSIVLADPTALAKEAENKAATRDALAIGTATSVGTLAPAATQAPAMAESGMPDGSAGAQQQPIALRSDFNPLATFAPSVRTDIDGRAQVSIKVPDNLTRYRVMVVAVDRQGNKFGTGESNITARLPLMVRPSAPRFLNFGDRFELPIVLQNQTDSPVTVDVAARATNLEIDNAGQRVTVPGNDRVEVRFPASTVEAGTTRIQIAAVSGDYADAATVDLPVFTPATSEAFATYGIIDEGATAQPVQYPSGVFPQYGGLEISTSSTALQALTDAVIYLETYPYAGSEQLSSRVLAIASLRDVLTAFDAEGLPSPSEMEASVDRDISRLQGMQNSDGGFPYWRRGFKSIPFNTIHAAHSLYRAEQKGFDVPDEMQQNALSYLREIEKHYPSWYSQRTRWTLSAYALYVRNLTGDRDSQKAQSLLNEAGLENLSTEAIGWLWPVIDDPAQLEAIRQFVNNHVVEMAGAANFTTYYDDQTYLLLSSKRRTDGILLEALMGDNPQSDVIPKVVNGLLAHRTKGHWGSTQDNVFVLLALDRYFNTYEAQTPDFVARIWLGNTYAGSSEFRGRTTNRDKLTIPMNYVMSETASAGGTQNLILSKDGDGRLYYRLGLTYAPTDLSLDPLDMGFVVQRRYEAVDDPGDVSQDSDGTWHIKAGAKVKVHITMVADNRRYHVALVDPLPAGLEIINPALAVSENIPQDPASPDYRYGWWWWGPWYEHQNMRDERAEAFTPLLWDGVYEYTYYARAATPGKFVVPPTKAEEMYSPEVFGRSGTDWVIIK